MSRFVMARVAGTFLRRWWLHLLPVVLTTALGVLAVRGTTTTYQSSATLYVERETYLSSLTAVRGGDIGWQTPAGFYSNQLIGLLGTEAFVETLATDVGLQAPGGETDDAWAQAIREAVTTSTSGDNLLYVSTTWGDAALAQQLAQAVIDSFQQWQIDADVAASTAAQTVLEPLVARYEVEVDQARDALDDYLATHPEPIDGGTRPTAQQLVIDRLNAEAVAAEARLTDARGKRQDAELATAQTESDVRQRIRLVDPPLRAAAADPVLIKGVATVVGLFGVGVVLAAAGVVAATALDRSVRTSFDVKDRIGAELLAVLPDAGRTNRTMPELRRS